MPAFAHITASLLLAAPGPVQQEYTVVDLGALGLDTSRAYAINEAGDVAGYTLMPAGDSHAFFWSKGVMVDAGTLPGASWGLGWGLNLSGTVVGESGLDAFRWDAVAGIRALAGTGSSSWAHDVNDQGVIVGEGEDSTFLDRAFVWRNGKVTFLGTAGSGSGAIAINEQGFIAGWERPPGSWPRATVWDLQGVPLDLNSPGSASVANDLNGSGQVVGRSNFPGTSVLHQAFLWENGAMVSLGALPGTTYPISEALGVNNSGQVVGWSDNPHGSVPDDHAFLWEGGVMRDLNDLIPPGSGWEIVRAHGINDAGQICGYGVFQGHTRGVLLEPAITTFHLEDPQPGIAGTTNTLEAVNGTPGARVFFLWGYLPGDTNVPGCTGLVVNMMLPIGPLGPVIADPAGRSVLQVPVPARAAGLRLLLQAASRTACEVTNLVTFRFQ